MGSEIIFSKKSLVEDMHLDHRNVFYEPLFGKNNFRPQLFGAQISNSAQMVGDPGVLYRETYPDHIQKRQ